MHLSHVLLVSISLGLCLARGLGSLEHPVIARARNLKTAAASLQPLLSKNARIVLPTDREWDDLQIRATSPRIHPNFNVVVEVATEEDVQKTVQVAAECGIPFLAVSGTHGWTKTLNNLPFGFQINLRKMNSTTVDKSGKTATIGGGTLQWEATKALFAHNKQAGIFGYIFLTSRKISGFYPWCSILSRKMPPLLSPKLSVVVLTLSSQSLDYASAFQSPARY